MKSNLQEKMKTLVKGEIFIIPNMADVWPENSGVGEYMKERLLKQLGIESDPTKEKMVQIQVCSEDSEDWGKYGEFQRIANVPFDLSASAKINKTDADRLMGVFVTRIPVRLLQDKKEGDLLELKSSYGIKIKLTCKQIGNRYESFGKFEEVLKYVTSPDYKFRWE